MIALPHHLDFDADQASSTDANRMEEKERRRADVLIGYLNQIRAAHELGAKSMTTTCLTHELEWLAEELRQRNFQVNTEVHMMHGQLNISWGK